MSKYSLLDATDTWITRNRFKAPRPLGLYPSEASVIIKNEDGTERVEGGCLRASYFRVTGSAPGAAPDARGERIMSVGTTIEKWFIDRWKEMGLWIDNNVKFYWAEYRISGELDTILCEPGTGDPFGIECKSFYGYDAAKNIFGSKWKKGFPKLNQLLQTLVYTFYFRDRLKYFKMIYMDRSDTKMAEFDIEVREVDGKWWPVVNGVLIKQFSVNDVLDRYQLLNYYIDQGILPPRDYEIVWDSARVEREKAAGNVSKTAYEEWKKGKRKLGDWNCRYCRFKETCWKDELIQLPEEEPE